MERWLLAAAAGWVLLAGQGRVQAELEATFSSGEGSDTPDKFPGGAGGGWAGPWVTMTAQQGVEFSSGLDQAIPLTPSGGPYLHIRRSIGSEAGEGQVRSGAARLWEGQGTATRAADLEFRWKVRIDEAVGFDDAFADALIFLEDGRQDGGGRALAHNGGSNDSTTWQLEFRVQSGSRMLRLAHGRESVFLPINWQTGVVYDFQILSRPSTKTWNVFLRGEDGSLLAERAGLSWRAAALEAHSGGWGAIAGLKRGPGQAGSALAFSLDDVFIRAAGAPVYAGLRRMRGAGVAWGLSGQVFLGTQTGASTKSMGWLGMPRGL